MGDSDDALIEDACFEEIVERSTVESDLLEQLPKANDLLPRSATKREEPLFAIGHQQIKIGELDGVQPEKEVLWGYSSNTCESPTRSGHRFLRAKTVTQPLAAHKLSSFPSFNNNPLTNNQGTSSKRISQNHQQQTSSIIPLKSLIAMSNNSGHSPQRGESVVGGVGGSAAGGVEEKELSSLIDQYTLIYSKFNPLSYDSFNTLKCSEADLVNAKKINFLEDTLFNHPVGKREESSETVSEGRAGRVRTSSRTRTQVNERSAERVINRNESCNNSSSMAKNSIMHSGYPNKIRFESRFECGNLSMAFEKTSRSYVLLMQNDINTYGCTQWFYFRVENGKTTGKIEFDIANFHKSSSLFTQGMKVLVYSSKKRHGEGSKQLGWHRDGFDIVYGPNGYARKRKNANQANQTYFSLKFTYDFAEEDDCVYFAYNYPYSYSRLQDELQGIRQCPRKAGFFKQSLLCRTLAGNRVDLVTITDSRESTKIKKSTIVISARVHPGETVSSFMMKGFIDSLLEDTQEAHFLRKHFVFKIIPMMNPDGVIHGNYRCSLSGKDLNRQWKKPDQSIFPEIYALKRLILKTSNLVLFCDLHGHSIKKNIFVYGCHDNSKPTACRELPYILSKIYEPFSFKDCNFNIKTEKEGTARVALWNRLRIPNIFTLESSFCGPSDNNIHFGVSDFERMGKALCSAFLIYFDIQIPVLDPPQTKSEVSSTDKSNKNEIVQQSHQFQTKKILFSKKELQKELLNNKELLAVGLEESAGSDSCPSEDEFEASTNQSTLSQSPTVPQPQKRLIESPSPVKKLMRKSQKIKPFIKVQTNLPSPPKDFQQLVPVTSALVIPPTKTVSMLRILENNVYSLNEFDEAQKKYNSTSLSERIFTLNFIGGNAANKEQKSSVEPAKNLKSESPEGLNKCRERRYLLSTSNQSSPLKQAQNSHMSHFIQASKYSAEGYYPISGKLRTGDSLVGKTKNSSVEFQGDQQIQLKKSLVFDPYRIKAVGEEKQLEGNSLRSKKIIEILRPQPQSQVKEEFLASNRVHSECFHNSDSDDNSLSRSRIQSNDNLLPQISSKFQLNYIPSNQSHLTSYRMDLLQKQANNSLEKQQDSLKERLSSIEQKEVVNNSIDTEINDPFLKKRWSFHQIAEPKAFNSRKHSQQIDGTVGSNQSNQYNFSYQLRRRESNNQSPELTEDKQRLVVQQQREQSIKQIQMQEQAQVSIRAIQKHAEIQLPGLGEKSNRLGGGVGGSKSNGIKESDLENKLKESQNWSYNNYGASSLAMVNEKSSRNHSYSRSSSIKKKIKAVTSAAVSSSLSSSIVASDNLSGSYDVRISKMKHRTITNQKTTLIPQDDDYILTNFI